MPVLLGLLTDLTLALELNGGLCEEFFHLLQAALLGGELQNLLPGVEVELDPPGDVEREVTVGWLYLYVNRPLRRCLDHPLQKRHTLLGQESYVLLLLFFEVLDIAHIVRLAAH